MIITSVKLQGKPSLKKTIQQKQESLIERKKIDTGMNFGEGPHTDSSYLSNPPSYTMLQAINVPEEGKGNTLFYNQLLAYEALPHEVKNKIENLKGVFSSQGKIAQTRELRMADHGTSDTKEIKSEHKLVQSIAGKKTIYCYCQRWRSFRAGRGSKAWVKQST